ncbi:MAG: hypothetical protein HGA51_02685 [Demequinaceae bacterium]|nr:hypothetical protein [Demequinaceae bacterium]
MKYFLKDASIVVMTLGVLFLLMAAIGNSLPLEALLMGGSVGLAFAAARAWRRTQEDRANAARGARKGH